MYNNISILEQLTAAIEQSGANLAPTYQEYMPLAFAIANSCGEEGRAFFHRICRMSPKYCREEADKLYGHSLQKGTGRNSLGTVFHLAEMAGVKLDKKLANLQNLQPSLTPPHTCVPNSATQAQAAAPTLSGTPPVHLPCFPDYHWPAFLQQIIDCGDSPAQRDILLLGSVTVLGSTINRLVSIMYGRKKQISVPANFHHRPARFRKRSTDLDAPPGRAHTRLPDGHVPGKNERIPPGQGTMGRAGQAKSRHPRTRTALYENAPHSR